MSNLKKHLSTSTTFFNASVDQLTNTANIAESLANDHSTKVYSTLQNCVKYPKPDVKNIPENTRPDFLRYQKIAQFKVSSSLFRSSKRAQYQASVITDNCGRFASKNEYGLVALNRCNRRTCPICATIKGKRLTNDIVKSLDQLAFTLLDECDENTPDNKKIIGLKINLNTGASPTLAELKVRLSVMHAVWARLLRTAKMREAVVGAYRSTEITQTDSNHANPHIHGLLLVRADTDVDKLSSHTRFYWHKTLKRELKKAKHEASVSASCNQLEPLYQHTKADVREWTRYATKGSYDYNKAEHREAQLKTTAEFWQTIDEATKGMRLTSLSGDLKEAVHLVRFQTQAEFDGVVHDYNRTHAWSDTKGKYVTMWEYDPEVDDKKAPLCQSLPYTEQPAHFGLLFKAEYDSHKIRRLEALGKQLLTNGDHSTYSQFSDLFIYDIKKSNPDVSIDYTEPVEVERESLKIRSKSLDSK